LRGTIQRNIRTPGNIIAAIFERDRASWRARRRLVRRCRQGYGLSNRRRIDRSSERGRRCLQNDLRQSAGSARAKVDIAAVRRGDRVRSIRKRAGGTLCLRRTVQRDIDTPGNIYAAILERDRPSGRDGRARVHRCSKGNRLSGKGWRR